MTLTLYDTKKAAVVWTRVIDKVNCPYTMHFVDLDLDGQEELLINTHEGGAGGYIYAYTIPDFKDM